MRVILQDLARWRLSCKILKTRGYLAKILQGYYKILQDHQLERFIDIKIFLKWRSFKKKQLSLISEKMLGLNDTSL